MDDFVYEPDEDTFLLWDSFKSELEKSFDISLNNSRSRTFLKTFSFLDMGCGSGYLGFEAKKLGFEKVVLVDKNPESVSFVRNLIESEDLAVDVFESDLFETVFGKFDFILFNTPYLPDESDSALNTLALNGGPDGNEITLRFVDTLGDYLTSEGFAMILVSSLSNPGVIEKRLLEKNLLFRVVGRKKLFFEELLVYKITKPSENRFNIPNSDLLLLKNKIPSTYGQVELFSRGKRGVIFKAKRNGLDVVIKLPLLDSDSKNTSLLEGRYLSKVNELGIGPRLIEFNDHFVSMEFIDGKLIGDFLFDEKIPNWSLVDVLKKIFHQLIVLDSNGINKFEMTNPYKHIILSPSSKGSFIPVLIDFERARFVRRTKNVTQFTEYLLSKKILPVLQKRGLLLDVDSFKEKIDSYVKTSILDVETLFE